METYFHIFFCSGNIVREWENLFFDIYFNALKRFPRFESCSLQIKLKVKKICNIAKLIKEPI